MLKRRCMASMLVLFMVLWLIKPMAALADGLSLSVESIDGQNVVRVNEFSGEGLLLMANRDENGVLTSLHANSIIGEGSNIDTEVDTIPDNAYLWDSMNSMQPLCNAFSKTEATVPSTQNSSQSEYISARCVLGQSYSTISLSLPSEIANTDTQKTMIIFSGNDISSISLENIVAIEQNCAINDVRVNSRLDEGTYTVVVGGYADGAFKVYTGSVYIQHYTVIIDTQYYGLQYVNTTADELNNYTYNSSTYTFEGLYTDKELTQKYSSDLFKEHMTLYVKWTYTLTFDTNGGNTITPLTFSSTEAPTLPTPTRNGYAFGGWYTQKADYADKYKYTNERKNITLYAKWGIPHTINFETNGGAAISPVTVMKDDTVMLPLTSKNGYVLENWYTDAEFTQKFQDLSAMPDNDLTLYAKWNEVTNKKSGLIIEKADFQALANQHFDETEYAIVPSLINCDKQPEEYPVDDYIKLSTCIRKKGGDASSYFKVDQDEGNKYITTSMCRFSNNNRGSRILFEPDADEFNINGSNETIVLMFDVMMKDESTGIMPQIWIGSNNMIITMDDLGVEDGEWAQVMLAYNGNGNAKLYKLNDDGTAKMIKTGEFNLSGIYVNYTSEIKSNDYPLGYPSVSFDNIYIYKVSNKNFGFPDIDNLVNYKGRINNPSNLRWEGTVAKWDSVEHASSYDINIIRNNSIIDMVEGVTETSYDFADILKDKCAYRFEVIAVTEEDGYDDSYKVTGPVKSLSNIKVGDYIQMGSYYNEPIIWRCIDVDDIGPLLITDKIITVKAYDAPGTGAAGSNKYANEASPYWGNSNLRCWLNSDEEAGNVDWACGNPPNSKALQYDPYDGEAGFLANFTPTEKYAIKNTIVQAGADNEKFNDIVTLPSENDINAMKLNSDILGTNYLLGRFTSQAIANSQYMQEQTYYDEETESNTYYQAGDAADYYTLLMNYDNYIGIVSRDGYIYSVWSDQLYEGVRPVIHLRDNMLMGGNGTSETPYTITDNVSATVSIPSDTISPKIYDVITIPIRISGNKGFSSALVSLSYDKEKYTFVDAQPGEYAVAATSRIDTALTDNGVNILSVSPAYITGEGTLFNVRLKTNINALNTTSKFTIKPIEFVNENKELLVVDTGNKSMQSSLNVSGDISGDGNVNSIDAVTLAQYLARYKKVSLNETQRGAADVYTDGYINVKDMYVLSQHIVNNTVNLSSLDASKSNGKFSLFGTSNIRLKTTAKYVENDNSLIDVTLSVKDNSGFTGFDFELGFDKTKLTPVSITKGSIISGDITSNINETGVMMTELDTVTAVSVSNSTISSDGSLFTIRFKLKEALSDSEILTFTNKGFTSQVEDVQLEADNQINISDALNAKEEPESNEVKNLKAQSDDGKVMLTWDKNDKALAYIIEQDGVQKTTVLTTSCELNELENGKEYTFTVKTLSTTGQSEGVSVKATPEAMVNYGNIEINDNGESISVSSDKSCDVLLIFAEYDSTGTLVSIEPHKLSLQANTPIPTPKKTITQGYTLKTMIWNSWDKMKPLHNAI